MRKNGHAQRLVVGAVLQDPDDIHMDIVDEDDALSASRRVRVGHIVDIDPESRADEGLPWNFQSGGFES